jgi:hypothetical protein
MAGLFSYKRSLKHLGKNPVDVFSTFFFIGEHGTGTGNLLTTGS